MNPELFSLNIFIGATETPSYSSNVLNKAFFMCDDDDESIWRRGGQ